VQQDALGAQAALALTEDDGHGDGIREYRIPDGSYPSLQACLTRCLAELTLFAVPIITLNYATRDPKTKLGALVHYDFLQGLCDPAIADPVIADIADLSNPAAVVCDAMIQDVTIDEIDAEPGDGVRLGPRYTVIASNTYLSLDDLLGPALAGA
jgi:hypothetical protein